MPTHAITDNPLGDVTVAVYQRQVRITDAQIKSLPTTAVELLPACGVGKMYIVHTAIFCLNNWAADYTNIHSGCAGFVTSMVTDAEYCNRLLNTNQTINNLLAHGASAVAVTGTMFTEYSLANGVGSENDAVFFAVNNVSNGNFTGGNAANELIITINYSIINL